MRTPVMRTPVMRTPVMRTPVMRTPVMRTPVMRTPVMRTPVMRTPVMRTPPLIRMHGPSYMEKFTELSLKYSISFKVSQRSPYNKKFPISQYFHQYIQICVQDCAHLHCY